MLKYLLRNKSPDMDLNAKGKSDKTALCWALYNKNVDITDDRGVLPLSYAAINGFDGILEDLLKRSKNGLNSPEHGTDMTALMFAAVHGHTRCVELLLQEKYIAVEKRDYLGNSALHSAAYCGHTQVVDVLLARGAGTDAKTWQDETTLHMAAMKGHIEIVEILLRHGHLVNGEDKAHRTALSCAARGGFEDIVALLLQNKAVIFEVPRSGFEFTPSVDMPTISGPAREGHLKIVQMLLDFQQTLSDAPKEEGVLSYDNEILKYSKGIALREALLGEHEELVDYLVHLGADTCLVDQLESSALHFAAGSGNEKIVNWVLETVPVDRTRVWDSWGNSPLNYAINGGHEAIIRILLEKQKCLGPNISNPETIMGFTPLHHAARQGKANIIRLLLEMGADIDTVDPSGNSALAIASSLGHEAAVRVLIEARANINAAGPDKFQTALFFACQGGHRGIIQLLLDNGAVQSINMRDSQYGRTPLDEAIRNGDHSLAKLLQDAWNKSHHSGH
ncbi:hypothetical protein TWF696_005452 [Orbilia brochopaga]|uniref:Uncharacterized protein n=1 Tax=Orbilia brochopaga TaxID=3140254 RepID=A0AAV9V1L3_9PEZI